MPNIAIVFKQEITRLARKETMTPAETSARVPRSTDGTSRSSNEKPNR